MFSSMLFYFRSSLSWALEQLLSAVFSKLIFIKIEFLNINLFF